MALTLLRGIRNPGGRQKNRDEENAQQGEAEKGPSKSFAFEKAGSTKHI